MKRKFCAFGLLFLLAVAPGWTEPDPPADPTPPLKPGLLDTDLEHLGRYEVSQSPVPGAHWHWEGDWMLGYQYEHINYGGYLNGTHHVSYGSALNQYGAVNTNMTMDMHMLMLMNAPSDDVNVMFMLPYTGMTMTGFPMMGTSMNEYSSGLGDLRASVILPVFDAHPNRVQFEAALSLPTGSINNRLDGTLLEYKMQTGSGTFDLVPAITYLGQTDDMTWGARLRGTIRLGTNSRGYRLGDMVELTAWWSPKISDNFAPSIRLEGSSWGNVRGQDRELPPFFDPESNPLSQGGTQLNLLFGINLAEGLDSEGHGHRFFLEGGFPIYQNLAGPQLRETWRLNASWNWTF